jgi:hypothetical protein
VVLLSATAPPQAGERADAPGDRRLLAWESRRTCEGDAIEYPGHPNISEQEVHTGASAQHREHFLYIGGLYDAVSFLTELFRHHSPKNYIIFSDENRGIGPRRRFERLRPRHGLPPSKVPHFDNDFTVSGFLEGAKKRE